MLSSLPGREAQGRFLSYALSVFQQAGALQLLHMQYIKDGMYIQL